MKTEEACEVVEVASSLHQDKLVVMMMDMVTMSLDRGDMVIIEVEVDTRAIEVEVATREIEVLVATRAITTTIILGAVEDEEAGEMTAMNMMHRVFEDEEE